MREALAKLPATHAEPRMSLLVPDGLSVEAMSREGSRQNSFQLPALEPPEAGDEAHASRVSYAEELRKQLTAKFVEAESRAGTKGRDVGERGSLSKAALTEEGVQAGQGGSRPGEGDSTGQAAPMAGKARPPPKLARSATASKLMDMKKGR
jgi:hypothetical protein